MEMYIAAMSFDVSTGRAAVVLTDEKKQRALPIFIGPFECGAIAVALNNIKPERPLSHDLMLNMILELGWVVRSVEVNSIDEGRYLASITVARNNIASGTSDEKVIDARPSDAIAIALRAKVPILVSPEVMAVGSVPTESAEVGADSSGTSSWNTAVTDTEEKESFMKFLEDLKASDFNKYAA
jgi:bifunctional DNase/RNase